MSKIFCPCCGTALEAQPGSTQHHCPNCGHTFTYSTNQPTNGSTPPPLTQPLPPQQYLQPPIPLQQPPHKSGGNTALVVIIAIAVILLMAAAVFAGFHYAAQQNLAAAASDTIITSVTGEMADNSNGYNSSSDSYNGNNRKVVVTAELDDAVMQRELTESDLNGLSQWQLKLLRNEVFARHGYIFQTTDMQLVFSQYSWYTPEYNDVNDLLSDTERYNVTFIKRHEM